MTSLQDSQLPYYKFSTSVETLEDYGTVGAVTADTIVATITDPGAISPDSGGGRGWYKVWGHGYHDADDGFKLQYGATDIVQIAAMANETIYFGPIYLEVVDDTNNISLSTAVATSAKASATIYAKKVSDA